MKPGHCYDCADPRCAGPRRTGPVWATVEALERLEADARERARKVPTLAGFAYATAEAAAYRNAAAQLAHVITSSEVADE